MNLNLKIINIVFCHDQVLKLYWKNNFEYIFIAEHLNDN